MSEEIGETFTEVKSTKGRKRRADRMDVEVTEAIGEDSNVKIASSPIKIPQFQAISADKLSVGIIIIIDFLTINSYLSLSVEKYVKYRFRPIDIHL